MQQLMNVLTVGAVYALAAVGYALVFSVLNMVNFAHTDVLTFGAYVGLYVSRAFGFGLFGQLAAGALAGAALGFLCERLCFRRAVGDSLRLMTAAIGVSVVLEYGMMLCFSAQPQAYGGQERTWSLWGMRVGENRLVAVCLAAAVFAGIAVFLRTRRGRQVRAFSQDALGAASVGVSKDAVLDLTFALSGAAAALAGVLYGRLYVVTPLMGATIGMKAFVCTVAGGKGSLWGAVLGAYLLSAAETAVCVFLGSGAKDAVAYVVLIVALLLTESRR